MREDGAELASLVANYAAVVNDGSSCHWIKRAQPFPESTFLPDANAVDRRFWALGHIAPEQPDSNRLLLRVRFIEDSDPAWAARYRGEELVFSTAHTKNSADAFFTRLYGGGGTSGGATSRDADEAAFVAWRSATFAPSEELEFKDIDEDGAKRSVLVWVRKAGASGETLPPPPHPRTSPHPANAHRCAHECEGHPNVGD